MFRYKSRTYERSTGISTAPFSVGKVLILLAKVMVGGPGIEPVASSV